MWRCASSAIEHDLLSDREHPGLGAGADGGQPGGPFFRLGDRPFASGHARLRDVCGGGRTGARLAANSLGALQRPRAGVVLLAAVRRRDSDGDGSDDRGTGGGAAVAVGRAVARIGARRAALLDGPHCICDSDRRRIRAAAGGPDHRDDAAPASRPSNRPSDWSRFAKSRRAWQRRGTGAS